MKKYLSIALTLVCIVLVISLVITKRGDDAQHENDSSAITTFSNQLDSAQAQIAACNGTILTFSNSLNESQAMSLESQAVSLTFSNRLTDAESTIALDTEQISNLNLQVAGLVSNNQTLDQRVMDLTNQMTSQVTALTRQIALTQTNLDQANKDYLLLENRFRIDVAERLVMQRKFFNREELKAQMQRLKEDPFVQEISEQSIYAGLDVEVKSNTFHVISPD
jgi:peptidoglycan hydrolase CwlO-like protein